MWDHLAVKKAKDEQERMRAAKLLNIDKPKPAKTHNVFNLDEILKYKTIQVVPRALKAMEGKARSADADKDSSSIYLTADSYDQETTTPKVLRTS